MENAHLASLEAKHADLDRKIHEERCRPAPDETLIHQLKREKLKIKDVLTTH
jgi:uncharacterized protein